MKNFTQGGRTYDGMGGDEMVVQDEADGIVAAEVVDIPLIFESHVSVVDSGDKSVVKVSAECGVVHEPDEVGAVRSECDVDSLSRGWGDEWDLAERSSKAQRVVAAVLELGGGPASRGRWKAIGVCVFIVDCSSCLYRYTVRE